MKKMLLSKFLNNVVSRQHSAVIMGGYDPGDTNAVAKCGCLGNDERISCTNGTIFCRGRGGLTYYQNCNGAWC